MLDRGYEISKEIEESYYRWQNSHPFLDDINIYQFASIYRFGIRYAIQATSLLSPQFEALRRLVDFAIGKPDHSECLTKIALLEEQIRQLQNN